MYITEISISNYRSIQDEQVIPIVKMGGESCLILLGINESGKSNLLRATSLLNKTVETDYNLDCFNGAAEKGEDVQIWFKLETDNPDFFRKKLVAAGIDEALAAHVTFDNVHRGISITAAGRANSHSVRLKHVPQKVLTNYVIVEKKVLPRTPENEVPESADTKSNLLTAEELEDFVIEILDPVFTASTPSVVFWRSSAEYRITDKIDLNSFKEKPSTSIPLLNCFNIAGISGDNIKKRVDATVGNAARTATLAELLSKEVTAHINEVWPEHKVNVKFHIEGNFLYFLVEDKYNAVPKYEVEQRSDGFKHFISILLNLSAENKMQSLKGKIILLDEPENHLHPSGQRYLRDELLRIAKKNTVIFATHSIFMVDTKHLDRHFSVKKEGGSTKILQIEKDNPYKEEVLYEALGTSTLQLVQPNVLICEGKTDRDIFLLYAKKCSADLEVPKVTGISADSVDTIIKYTKFFNNKVVKGFVLVDSDTDGKREKTRILGEPNYSAKNTFEINDILQTDKDATLEDLFDKALCVKVIKQQFAIDVDLDATVPFMSQIKGKLQSNQKAFREEEKREFKKLFFTAVSKLSKEQLKEQPYFNFMARLCKKIGSA